MGGAFAFFVINGDGVMDKLYTSLIKIGKFSYKIITG